MINPDITQLIQAEKQNMINFRRELHRHPELPFEEVRTTAKIAQALDKMNINYRLTKPTGVIAEIKGGKHGKTIALRADIDALPILELTQHIDYISCNEGKMHACGHDGHTAMLLTAAHALNTIRHQLPGHIRLIFQPAEEIGTGAKVMIEQGALEQVNAIFGMHLWSKMPTGKISCYSGPIFAIADTLKVVFKGRGGHGSMPHDAIDTVVVAASFIMNLQSIVSREIDPLETAVVTIGKIDAGTRFNVIAEMVTLEGTVRTFNPVIRDKIVAAIKRYAAQIAIAYGAKAIVEYSYGPAAVINEQKSANLAQVVIKKTFGQSSIYHEKPTTGGEDFSYYLKNIPGAFALVGAGNPQKKTQYAHHHGCFNIDEDALTIGAELFAQYAWAYLNQQEF